jgi:tetratricopeptide repeat protein 21B
MTPQLDELSLDASCGALECHIQLGQLEDATGQLMFLEDMFSSQSTLGKKLPPHLAPPSADSDPPILLYLRGLHSWKLEDVNHGLALLERAIATGFEVAAQHPPSLSSFIVLCPR